MSLRKLASKEIEFSRRNFKEKVLHNLVQVASVSRGVWGKGKEKWDDRKMQRKKHKTMSGKLKC